MEVTKEIIRKFMTRFNKEEVEGILLYGSAVSGRKNKKSDIDLLVIKGNDYTEQVVGCTIIDEVKVEYFVYGLGYLYDMALKEIEKNDPSHLTKFITSLVIYDKNGDFSEVVEKIKELYQIRIKEDHSNYTKKSLLHIKNRMDDLESLINTDTFYCLYYDILSRIRDLYTRIYGLMIVPLAKSEKLYKDPKYMREYIDSRVHNGPDKVFMDKYLKALKLKDKEKMLENIKELYAFAFKKEKFNADEFEIVFSESERFGI